MEIAGSLPFSQEPSTRPILSRINPVHALASYFFKFDFIFSHLLLGLPTGRFDFKFSHQNPMCISISAHTCHMPSPSHLRCSYGRDEFVSHVRENVHLSVFENSLPGRKYLLNMVEASALPVRNLTKYSMY